jgi:hypothetical protein
MEIHKIKWRRDQANEVHNARKRVQFGHVMRY